MIKNTNYFFNLLFRGFFTASGLVAEIIALSLIFDLKINVMFLILIILLVSAIYLWDFYQEYSYHFKHVQKISLFVFLILVILVFIYLLLHFGNFLIILVSIILLAVGLIYNALFKQLTKQIVGFKDFFVIFCFETVIVLFLILNKISFVQSLFILLFTISRDIVNVSYCDIKDFVVDEKQKLSTLVHVLGKERIYALLQSLNAISIIILIIFSISGFIPYLSLSLIFPVIITSAMLIYSKSNNNYSPYLVDIEYFVWFFTAVIFKWILT